jgi:hypothetical protein
MKDINYGLMPPTFEKPEDWISYYPKSSSAAPHVEEGTDAKPESEASKIVNRFLVIPREGLGQFMKYNWETYGQRDPYRDVFRERFGEKHPAYQRLMEMADSIGEANNTFIPSSGNRRNKEALRKAFDDIGIERKY